jgi:hypothetical protein
LVINFGNKNGRERAAVDRRPARGQSAACADADLKVNLILDWFRERL